VVVTGDHDMIRFQMPTLSTDFTCGVQFEVFSVKC